MPRTSPLLPSSENHHYSKSEKTKKPFPPPSSPPTLPANLYTLSSFPFSASLSESLAPFFSPLSFPPPVPPVFRCGRVQDSFRGHYLSTAHNQRSSKISGLDRPKFLGFVGILTGFDSVDRRLALRSTWFPSDPEVRNA
ncbi:putative beta-1 3-galactosyltransferase 12 [Bienertia sinuspersici]